MTKKAKTRYNVRTSYFVKKGDEWQKLRLSRKYVLKLFGDQSDEVKKYAKENKLSFKRDKDLKKIFSQYSL